jgi:Zn-dependent peptidase ImmA (M78 family)/transcriptional regulator with XRE-family HTH domain
MNRAFDFATGGIINGDRVRQAREIAAQTQTELARRVGISQAMIAHIENGLKQTSLELAEAIARETQVSVDFLRRQSGPTLPEGTLLFRARASASAKELTQARRSAECVFEMYMSMAAQFELPPVTLRPIHGVPSSAAAAAREMMGLAPGRPIPHLLRAFEKAGGIVITVPHLPGREAFAVWANDRPVVGILSHSVGDRLRFSAAHEIGHLLMHVHPASSRTAEKDAHEFAAELLMPGDVFEHEFSRGITLDHLAVLKLKWGVSINALAVRARDLGCLPRRRFESLMKQIAVRGWRLREPEHLDLPVERPRALRQMAEYIYGNPLDYERVADDFKLAKPFVRSVLESCTSFDDINKSGSASAAVISIADFSNDRRTRKRK